MRPDGGCEDLPTDKSLRFEQLGELHDSRWVMLSTRAAVSFGRAGIETIVIDRHNHHLFQPLLYQVATAALSATVVAEPIRKVLRRHGSVQVLFFRDRHGLAGGPDDLRAQRSDLVTSSLLGEPAAASHLPGDHPQLLDVLLESYTTVRRNNRVAPALEVSRNHRRSG